MVEIQHAVNRRVEIQLRRTEILKDIHDLGSRLASKHAELGIAAREFQEAPDPLEAITEPIPVVGNFNPKGVIRNFHQADRIDRALDRLPR